MSAKDSYRRFFQRATGIEPGPYPYQTRLALDPELPQLLSLDPGRLREPHRQAAISPSVPQGRPILSNSSSRSPTASRMFARLVLCNRCDFSF